MKKYKVLLLGGMLLAVTQMSLPGGTLPFFEGFETRNRGALDANYAGPNANSNGAPGNAWWGWPTPNLLVVGAEIYPIPGVTTNNVTPHSGTNMVRGIRLGAPDFDRDYYNIAYRLNQSNIFTGNIVVEWWFFDPIGPNTNANAAPQYQDHISLAFYTAMPLTNDYPGDQDPGFPLARLSLGASDSISTNLGYKATNYQAQILHTMATNAYDLTNGWFNLPVIRSNGWHRARIAVSPRLGNGTANVTFYIDDMVTPKLTNNTATTNGFNCIVMSSEYNANHTGYYDDISFDAVPLPVVTLTKSGSNAIVTWSATGWTLQTSTNLPNFVDIVGATSPHTNAITGARFFRLRY